MHLANEISTGLFCYVWRLFKTYKLDPIIDFTIVESLKTLPA